MICKIFSAIVRCVCHSFNIRVLANSTTRRFSLSLTHSHRLVLIRKITLKTLDTSIGSTSPRCLMLIDGLTKILVTSYISSIEQEKRVVGIFWGHGKKFGGCWGMSLQDFSHYPPTVAILQPHLTSSVCQERLPPAKVVTTSIRVNGMVMHMGTQKSMLDGTCFLGLGIAEFGLFVINSAT